MTYISARANGIAAQRARKRQRQKSRHVRVRRSTKRELRELGPANLDECFNVCRDRGFHCDPDINIGSDVDPSRNRFLNLDSGWSSTTSGTITPLQSSFTFTSANQCSSEAQSSSTSLHLPSIPTTPPSYPIVKLPDTVSNNGPPAFHPEPGSHCASNNGSRNFPPTALELPFIPSAFLYHDESRELLQGIEDLGPNPAKLFATSRGQEASDTKSKGYRIDIMQLKRGGYYGLANGTSLPILNSEASFIGAALADMRKLHPAPAITASHGDSDFYKYTRSYLLPSDTAAVHSNIASVPLLQNVGANTSQTGKRHPQTLKLTETFPRWLRTMRPVSLEPYSRGRLLTTTSSADREPGTALNKISRWQPANLHPVKQLTSMHNSISPRLTTTAARKASLSSRRGHVTDSCFKPVTDFRDSNYETCLQETDLRWQHILPKAASNTNSLDTNAAMATFEDSVSQKSAIQANTTTLTRLWIPPRERQVTDSRADSTMPLSNPASPCPPRRRNKTLIRDTAIQSPTALSIPSRTGQTVDLATCPSSICNALVPAQLYEHQYLGWPRHITGEDTAYRDSSWMTIGASIAHLQEADQSTAFMPAKLLDHQSLTTSMTEEDVLSPGKTMRKKVAYTAPMQKEASAEVDSHVKLEQGLEKNIQYIAQDLGLETEHMQDCQCFDAWLQALAGQGGAMGVEHNSGFQDMSEDSITREDGEEATNEYFTHDSVAENDDPLPALDQVIEKPDSEVDWTEISTETESEDDWGWSEDDLGA